MIVFELTMPNRGSWNGRWSGDGSRFIRVRKQRDVPKEYWNQDYYYRWDDGWTACVTATQMPADAARLLEKKSDGFRGYDWMIDSIIRYGDIRLRKDWD